MANEAYSVKHIHLFHHVSWNPVTSPYHSRPASTLCEVRQHDSRRPEPWILCDSYLSCVSSSLDEDSGFRWCRHCCDYDDCSEDLEHVWSSFLCGLRLRVNDRLSPRGLGFQNSVSEQNRTACFVSTGIEPDLAARRDVSRCIHLSGLYSKIRLSNSMLSRSSRRWLK